VRLDLLDRGRGRGDIELHFGLTHDQFFLGLSAGDVEHSSDEAIQVRTVSSEFGSTKPLETQLLLKPGLAITATLQRQHYNSQTMYVIKLFPC
jgi:hypothetical protein